MMVLAVSSVVVGVMFGYFMRGALSGETYTEAQLQREIERKARDMAVEIAGEWYETLKQEHQWSRFYLEHKPDLERAFAETDERTADKLKIKRAPRVGRDIIRAAHGVATAER